METFDGLGFLEDEFWTALRKHLTDTVTWEGGFERNAEGTLRPKTEFMYHLLYQFLVGVTQNGFCIAENEWFQDQFKTPEEMTPQERRSLFRVVPDEEE